MSLYSTSLNAVDLNYNSTRDVTTHQLRLVCPARSLADPECQVNGDFSHVRFLADPEFQVTGGVCTRMPQLPLHTHLF